MAGQTELMICAPEERGHQRVQLHDSTLLAESTLPFSRESTGISDC